MKLSAAGWCDPKQEAAPAVLSDLTKYSCLKDQSMFSHSPAKEMCPSSQTSQALHCCSAPSSPPTASPLQVCHVRHPAHPSRAQPAPSTLADPTIPKGFLVTLLFHCKFLPARADLSPLSSVTNAHYPQIAISVCDSGPSLTSWNRRKKFHLLLCPLARPFNTPTPGLAASLFESQTVWRLHAASTRHIQHLGTMLPLPLLQLNSWDGKWESLVLPSGSGMCCTWLACSQRWLIYPSHRAGDAILGCCETDYKTTFFPSGLKVSDIMYLPFGTS